MKVEQTLNDPLRKEFLVEVEGSVIGNRFEEWIQERAKTVKMDGFRPGKAPLDVVRKSYGYRGIESILKEYVDEAGKKIARDESFDLIESPSFDIVESYDPENSSSFKFKVIFILRPELKIQDFKNISIDKLSVLIQEGDVLKEIEKILEREKFYRPFREGEVLQKGDRYRFYLEAKQGKKVIKEFDGKKFNALVGEEDVLSKLFEEKLQGAKKGDEVSFVHVFLPSFPDGRLKGKTVQFLIRIEEVEVSYKPSLDDDMAKNMGLESFEELKKNVEKSLQSKYDSTARLYHKRHLLDALSETYAFEAPSNLVEREFAGIWARLKHEIEKNPEEKGDKTEEEIEQECRKLSDRRVRLGLLISHIAKEHKIQVTQGEINMAILRESYNAGKYGDQVFEMYKKNPAAVDQMASNILEEKVCNFIFSKVKTVPVQVNIQELRDRMETILPGFADEEVDEAVQQLGKRSEDISEIVSQEEFQEGDLLEGEVESAESAIVEDVKPIEPVVQKKAEHSSKTKAKSSKRK